MSCSCFFFGTWMANYWTTGDYQLIVSIVHFEYPPPPKTKCLISIQFNFIPNPLKS